MGKISGWFDPSPNDGNDLLTGNGNTEVDLGLDGVTVSAFTNERVDVFSEFDAGRFTGTKTFNLRF